MHYHVEEMFQIMVVKLWLNEVLTQTILLICAGEISES